MYFWYKLLTYLFYPFSPFFLFLRKLKKKEHSIRFKEKLSQINTSRGEGFLIWFHVASVGEGLSILPLVENFEKDEKIQKILITSVTLSSSAVLEKKLSNNKKTTHQFLPFDVPNFVSKFLNHWSPDLAIFIDSEIWPNFIFQINEKNIPLLLVNGRITKKSFDRWNFLNKFSKKIFGKFDLCIASNSESENYLKILGAKNVKNCGNLKFANTKLNSGSKLDPVFLNKIANRKIWCAASTHPTEESFCAKTHLNLKSTFKNIFTIIIPRHAHRVKAIDKELSGLNLKVVFYSNLSQMDADTDILLVDTYGENSKFFNISKSVFLGGSLIKHGGQNPIEPSRLGSKIFHGAYVSNFSEIYKYLESLGVTRQVNTPDQLTDVLLEKFYKDKLTNSQVLEKIDNYGFEILNKVIKEIKLYINT